jgi:hypothetical protein
LLATKNENEWKNKKIFQKFGLFFKILTSTSYAIWLKLDTDLAPHPSWVHYQSPLFFDGL